MYIDGISAQAYQQQAQATKANKQNTEATKVIQKQLPRPDWAERVERTIEQQDDNAKVKTEIVYKAPYREFDRPIEVNVTPFVKTHDIYLVPQSFEISRENLQNLGPAITPVEKDGKYVVEVTPEYDDYRVLVVPKQKGEEFSILYTDPLDFDKIVDVKMITEEEESLKSESQSKLESDIVKSRLLAYGQEHPRAKIMDTGLIIEHKVSRGERVPDFTGYEEYNKGRYEMQNLLNKNNNEKGVFNELIGFGAIGAVYGYGYGYGYEGGLIDAELLKNAFKVGTGTALILGTGTAMGLLWGHASKNLLEEQEKSKNVFFGIWGSETQLGQTKEFYPTFDIFPTKEVNLPRDEWGNLIESPKEVNLLRDKWGSVKEEYSEVSLPRNIWGEVEDYSSREVNINIDKYGNIESDVFREVNIPMDEYGNIYTPQEIDIFSRRLIYDYDERSTEKNKRKNMLIDVDYDVNWNEDKFGLMRGHLNLYDYEYLNTYKYRFIYLPRFSFGFPKPRFKVPNLNLSSRKTRKSSSHITGQLDLFAQDILDLEGITKVKLKKGVFEKHFAAGKLWSKQGLELVKSRKKKKKKRRGRKWKLPRLV